MNGDDPAETELLITELLRRVKVVFALFGEDLHPWAYLEVRLDISDYGEIVQRSRSDAIKYIDFD